MSIPILTTKLYAPPLRPGAVHRPRLLQRLNQGLHGKLTLVSAPAGFGKTTLISAWIADCGRPVAWISLDGADSDPVRFLRYLAAALETVAPHVSESVAGMLNAPQPPAPETVLTALLNELTGLSDAILLVLDDYHVLDAPPVDQALAFLLDHMPPQLHLAITTREDPSLPLARLRARGQMTELRAADLRFTPDEAASFLAKTMGLTLSAGEVAALEQRTEGWIAGLQMAALSVQGRADTAAFVDAFAGSHRFVLDYLVEEVLQRQPSTVRRFLLQTAILDRLSAPLCEAVTGQADSGELLAGLERSNLFVIPLDDQRRWYRFHHLFAEVLLARFAAEERESVPILHQRASRWYADNGWTAEAIHHALAAQDFEAAAELIELAWPEMDAGFQTGIWQKWADALPHGVVAARPVLIVGYAWALLNVGELARAGEWLLAAEAMLDPASGDALPHAVIVDGEQFATLNSSIASARAYTTLALGDIPSTVRHAQRALDLLPADEYLRRSQAASILGLAQWNSGDLEAAHRSLADAMAGFHKAGHLAFALSGTYGLADIRVVQGRLGDALRTYEQALEIAVVQGESPIRGTTDLCLGLAELHRERGDSEGAARFMAQNDALGEDAALQDWPYRVRRARAQFAVDAGDLDEALALLDQAEQHYFPTPVPEVQPIPAIRARVWLRQGRVAQVRAWADERGLCADDEVSFLREFEHITLARLLMAEGDEDTALALLGRLLRAAEEGGRRRRVIEIRTLTALIHHRRGDLDAGMADLSPALALAKPEGFVRIFVDEGPTLAPLLVEAAQRGIEPAYAAKVLATFERSAEQLSQAVPRTQPLIDPLSERELEVLHLLTTELSGPQMADRLMVSLNTLRTHTKNIYSKLGVGSRRAAVRRAADLHLL